jgi:hypothetical protein
MSAMDNIEIASIRDIDAVQSILSTHNVCSAPAMATKQKTKLPARATGDSTTPEA